MIVVMMLVFFIVIVVMVFMLVVMIVVAVFMLIIVIVVVMMMCGFFLQKCFEFIIQRVFLRHGSNQLCAGKLVPFGCDNRCCRIELPQAFHGIVQLRFGQTGGMAENQAACVCNLIVEELAEVLLIHFAFFCIDYGREAVQLDILHMEILHGADDIAELADTGGLNQNAVRMILLQNLTERFAEIADERAADAAGIHLVDLNACLFKESAVNADLTEFVFDQHKLFAVEAVLNELLDQRRLTGSEEAGENGDFCHKVALLSMVLPRKRSQLHIIAYVPGKCNFFHRIFKVCTASARLPPPAGNNSAGGSRSA